jgi:hypothetical protein
MLQMRISQLHLEISEGLGSMIFTGDLGQILGQYLQRGHATYYYILNISLFNLPPIQLYITFAPGKELLNKL